MPDAATTSKIDKIKRAAAIAEEYQGLEQALSLVEFGLKNETMIDLVRAQDTAEAERSIPLLFTVEETKEVFEAIRAAITPRYQRLKDELDNS